MPSALGKAWRLTGEAILYPGRKYVRDCSIKLPQPRPLQPSQICRSPGQELVYQWWRIRDAWRFYRGKCRISRCEHCWNVLHIFTPAWRHVKHTEWPLGSNTLVAKSWKECSFCWARTREGYIYRCSPLHPWEWSTWTRKDMAVG